MTALEQLSELEWLMRAFYVARRGKRDLYGVCRYEFRLEQQLLDLQERLRDKTYRPSEYTYFTVHDPKTRQVSAPAFTDRVVHHALLALIEPDLDKRMINDTYACRRGRGTHYGAKRVKGFLKAARSVYGPHQELYVLQCDIAKYFQSVSWDILLSILARTIRSQDLMDLIEVILSTHEARQSLRHPPGEQLTLFSDRPLAGTVWPDRRQGLPIGNLTSQLFANVYLGQLDHFVKDSLGERWYGRYMDDFLVIGPDRRHLAWVREEIRQFLVTRLALELHKRKVSINNVRLGVPFVGYRIWHDHMVVRGNTLRRMEKNHGCKKRAAARDPRQEEALRLTKISLEGHFKLASAYGLKEHLFGK